MRCSSTGSTPRSVQRASRSRSSVANPTVLSAGRSCAGQRTAEASPSSRSPASSSRMMPSCSALVISRGGGVPLRWAASRSTANAYECTVRTSGSRTTARSPALSSVAVIAALACAPRRAEPVSSRTDSGSASGCDVCGGGVDQQGALAGAWPAQHAHRAAHARLGQRGRSELGVWCGHVGMTPRGSDKTGRTRPAWPASTRVEPSRLARPPLRPCPARRRSWPSTG